jgi:hypothetical protein
MHVAVSPDPALVESSGTLLPGVLLCAIAAELPYAALPQVLNFGCDVLNFIRFALKHHPEGALVKDVTREEFRTT